MKPCDNVVIETTNNDDSITALVELLKAHGFDFGGFSGSAAGVIYYISQAKLTRPGFCISDQVIGIGDVRNDYNSHAVFFLGKVKFVVEARSGHAIHCATRDEFDAVNWMLHESGWNRDATEKWEKYNRDTAISIMHNPKQAVCHTSNQFVSRCLPARLYLEFWQSLEGNEVTTAPNETKPCTCELSLLMRDGCQCGGA